MNTNQLGYNIGFNCGEDAGQSIMHVHLHLIPRYHGDVENPRGGYKRGYSIKKRLLERNIDGKNI